MKELSWSQIKRNTFLAISRGDLEELKEMLEKYPKAFNAFNVSGDSLMHVAAEQNNKDILEFLYSKGFDVNITRKNDKGKVTPIFNAIRKNLIENIVWLINHGAVIDTGIGMHATPLISAAFGGNIEIVKILLESGADVNAYYFLGEGKARKKITAIVAANMNGHKDLAKYLSSHGGMQVKLEEAEEEVNKLVESKHDEILKHLEKYFGKTMDTISEIVPGSEVAIKLHIMSNSDDDFITIATTGMSNLPMQDCDEAYEERFAELIIKLPNSWPIKKEDMKDINNYWPLGWIRGIAHIPHMYDGWLGKDVIIPNGEPPKPVAQNTKLSCFMICKPKENGLERFESSEGDIINFYTIVPIFKEERNIALEKGCEYLINLLKKKGITDVVDILRANAGL